MAFVTAVMNAIFVGMHRILFVLSLLIGLAPATLAQRPQPALTHTFWRAELAGTQDQPRIRIAVDIAPTWKLYALDTPPPSPRLVLRATAPEGARVGSFLQPVPKEEDDPALGVRVRYFDTRAVFEAPVENIRRGDDGTIEATSRFSICDPSICLPPTTVTLAVNMADGSGTTAGTALFTGLGSSPSRPVEVTPRPVAPTPAPEPTPAPAQTEPETPTTEPPAEGAQEEEEMVLVAPLTAEEQAATPTRAGGEAPRGLLLLAALAGLAALLTPCVFPMIPLTVSYFTRHANSNREALGMASVYAFSIIGTFTGLGLLMALFVGASGAGSIAANPWVNLFIGVVFVVFGLSLLGLFEIRLPSGLVNAVGRQESRSGVVGVFFMGLTLTLVSFSCTVPFVGALLAMASQGSWRDPIIGMVVFSTVFALPFFAFALFPRALGKLPKSGDWMTSVKVTLGFIELAAALKFLSQADLVWGFDILSRPLAIAISIVIFVMAGLYLIGRLPLQTYGEALNLSVGRLVVGMVFFSTALYMVPGLFGAGLGLLDAYLPPRRATDFNLTASSAQQGGMDAGWHVGVQGKQVAWEEAATTGKPIFIDFTGYTCTNCRYMEANVFTVPEVDARLAQFVRLKLYTDDLSEGGENSTYQLELTGTVALPTYAILSPDGSQVLDILSGTASVARFQAFLDQALPAQPLAVAR